jgi:LPXTG-motif cell wall-anchored protein
VKNARVAFAVLGVLVFVACAWPAVTLAASATAVAAKPAASSPATVAAPIAIGPVDAQFWPQGDPTNPNQAAVIADVQLSPSVKLPARVRIPIPKGATVQWAGEILGGDPSADPERTFVVVKGAGGGSYAEFTLQKARRGQIDCSGIQLKTEGEQVSFTSSWVQSTETTAVLLTVRLPAGVSRVTISPKPEGSPQTNMQGESLYALPLLSLPVGQKQDVSVSYSTNPSGTAPATGSSRTAILVVLGVLLVGAVGVLAFAITRQRRNAEDGPDSDDRRRPANDSDETDDWFSEK